MSVNLGEKVGPMPLGAWVAAVAGGLGIMYYQRKRAATTTAPAATIDPTQTLVGTGGAGAVGGYYATDGSSVATPSTTSATLATNQQWGNTAFSWLAAQGMAPDVADAAIRDYLAGKALSTQENALVSQVLGKYGQPPESLPDAPPLPAVPVQANPVPVAAAPAPAYNPPPAPAPAPAPAAAPNTYTVRPGDSLSKIAARYPQAWITWQSIFNANRGIISNPNLIHPGQVLVIA